jgi:hypothetical protein
MCSKIIKRQDIDTDLLLQFINQQRRAVFRSTYLYKLDKWIKNIEPEDGYVEVPNLKQARYVEYSLDNKRKKLFRLNTYGEVMEIYDSMDEMGEPQYYLVLSGQLRLVPIPIEGLVNVFGEFYPDDITNSNTEDVLSKEISDAIVYLGCAEYFDMLGETDTANFWRSKGQSMLAAYMTEIKRQMTDDTELLARDPFGNLGIVHGRKSAMGTVMTIDELSGGVIEGGE